MADVGVRPEDPFLVKYQPDDLQIASEFLVTWLPFLSRDLCHSCTQILSDRIRSLDPELNVDAEPVCSEHCLNVSTPNYAELSESNKIHDDDFDTKSVGSGKDEEVESLGSWKDGANGWNESIPEASTSEKVPCESPLIDSPSRPMSWADMAQEEDDLKEEEEEEDCEVNKRLVNNVNASTGKLRISKLVEKPNLSREQIEQIRFRHVNRKKDFICLERINGKIVNILDGLELHTGIFSALDQKKIVDYISMLQEKGKKGEFRARTFTAPQKWMRGKGRVTIQFGCCYNYVTDRCGNPPGILQNEAVDPIPHLFKVIIRRLVRWHVLPPTCVPDSCIVNIYEEGDCIPPHIDNHDFVRPFCTVSFLSKCNILFGTNLKVVGAGEFEGPMSIPLPVGSVLVLNGNCADVAKHCVPAVPTKRISITFRRMDDSKRPIGFVPEPDLQGIQPLVDNEVDQLRRSNPPKSEHHGHQPRRVGGRYPLRFSERPDTHYSDPRYSNWNRRGPPNKGRLG